LLIPNINLMADNLDSDVIIHGLHDLATSDTSNFDSKTVQTRALALFARLKALNRAANAATRSHKQATADARQQVDQAHLGLQNLLYEKRHLEREIDKCRHFASIHQDIPLYSLEEFQELAPPESKTDEILSDEHQLVLSRLNFELSERQRLDKRKKELLQQKEDSLKETRVKISTIDSVKAQIETLMKAAADIQKKVDDLVQQPSQSNSGTPAPSG